MPKFDTGILDNALREQRERLERERRGLLELVEKTLREIQRRYDIQSAYIVGSLLLPNRWYPFSDIDVALSGCSEHLLTIMKELEEATGKRVDVIDLDRHPFPQLFKRKGVRVYG